MAETIGKRVKRLREARAWSQRRLGGVAATSGAYISQLEAETIPKPGVSQLQKIAVALGVSLTDLIAPEFGTVPDQNGSTSHSAGVPEDVLAELNRIWPDLTPEDQQTALRVLRSLWESQRARAAPSGI